MSTREEEDATTSKASQDLLSAALNQSGLTMLDSPVSAFGDETEQADDPFAALGFLPPSIDEPKGKEQQSSSPVPAQLPTTNLLTTTRQTNAVTNISTPVSNVLPGPRKLITVAPGAKIIKVPIPRKAADGNGKPNIIRLPINGIRCPIIVKKPTITTQTLNMSSPKFITIGSTASSSSTGPVCVVASSISNSPGTFSSPAMPMSPKPQSTITVSNSQTKTTYAKVMVGNKRILIPIIQKNGVNNSGSKVLIPSSRIISTVTPTHKVPKPINPTVSFASNTPPQTPKNSLNLGSLFVESAEKEVTSASIIPVSTRFVSDKNNNSNSLNKAIITKATQQNVFYSRNCVSPLTPVADILSSMSNLRPQSPLLANSGNLVNGRSYSPSFGFNIAAGGKVNVYSNNANVNYRGKLNDKTQQKTPVMSRSQSVTTFYKNQKSKSEKDFNILDLKNNSIASESKKQSDMLVQEEEWEEEQAQHSSTYSEYKPSKLKIGLPHPDSVVETSSLSSVPPPDITYRLSIPDETIDYGLLSALQLETITYACQKHETFLPNGERAGYLVGDGAGVGKGRTVAGIIFENYLLGRKRALWFSVSNDLKYDSERDLKDIGAKTIHVHMLNKFKYGKISSRENCSVKKGVIFATYSSLIGESHSNSKYGTRLKQILHWCGKDFDGVIVFDECHKAKNLIPSGSAKPTKTGYTVVELQRRLPNARVIYASATGASEPRNMAYMSRLGLWGQGTPFRDFMDFIQAVERRGVGAMEMVAMDLKSRGAYIARQLSFHGVSFRINEVPLMSSFIKMYNSAVRLWVAAREAFQIAACLIDAEHHMKKTMWGQFWAAHQRFFKYLCIAAKVDHTSQLAREAVKHGKCVVIGLQSTGEARTLDQLEKSGGELDDFVSTAKGVFQNLIEQHFPAPNRKRVTDLFGKDFYKKENESDDGKQEKNGKRKRKPGKKGTNGNHPSKKSRSSNADDSDGMSSDDDKMATSSSDDEGGQHPDIDSDASLNYSDEDIGKIFGGGSDSDEWGGDATPKSKVKKTKKVKKESSNMDEEADRMLELAGLKPPTVPAPTLPKEEEKNSLASLETKNDVDHISGLSSMNLPGLGPVERAQALKRELLAKLEAVSLPNNTLDELIDALGGPENVAEMTGRKGRIVSTEEGNIQYESRSENDVRCDMLNLTEKQRFMDGEKNIAIISEAASSGISLQSDRRARNQRRRLHITLELPWSADRAIQQFGRTHRSNQVNAPEYVFLISELAGEQRFASVVAKRLESLGALTHGDRRATETRDLSQYNFDNKFGRLALESIMKAIASLEVPIVHPPATYPGLFFRDIRIAMVGVGLISLDGHSTQAQLEKEYNNIVKFMNRILGMEVMQQNAVFQFFSDTLSTIVQKAKSRGQFDQGIMDVGAGEDCVERVDCKRFELKSTVMHSNNGVLPQVDSGYVELHTVKVERGMSWDEAEKAWSQICTGDNDGFYLSQLKRNEKCMAVLCVEGRQKSRRRYEDEPGVKMSDASRFFTLHRPHTGKQVKRESLATLLSRYRKVTPDEARLWWGKQYDGSLDMCSHAYWQGNCNRQVHGVPCSIGKRRRTYHVLSGSVLATWRLIEQVLSLRAPSMYKMQIVRLKTEDRGKLVGLLIPSNCVSLLISSLTNPMINAPGSMYAPEILPPGPTWKKSDTKLLRTASTPLFSKSSYSLHSNDIESDDSFEEVDEEDAVDDDFSPDEITSSVLFPNNKVYSWLS